MGFRLACAAVAVSLFSGAAFSDELLWADRVDSRVPVNCRDPQIRDYGSVQKLYFYSITGGLKAGFTNEVELQRGEATTLWQALKSNQALTGVLSSLYDFLEASKQTMGFDFQKEGDVLEALALQDLTRIYPETEYFTTGGISYHNQNAGKFETVGEVDIVVGRRSDCAVVAVGEAKLGVAQLSHAHQQVSRFVSWIKAKLCSSPTPSQTASQTICSL